ncbi:MAG: alpha/beta fold hydrolase [Betaproteobacteria bacterium]|nr:alpha/beta fold hydrolase [Betaproteobacteria bacterium]
MHYLEAGHAGRPTVLLLHGFPELAFSWRHQMTALADAGFHVIAPDQRGYGRTTGSDDRFMGDWQASCMLNLVQDMLDLCQALHIDHVHAVVGHDFGSPVAAWSALTRPDVFRAVVLMSAPFAGPPSAAQWSAVHDALVREVHALGQLHPSRQHYQWYYAGPQANPDMWHAPQGLHDFLRAYYHVKSADWADNQPHALSAWRADVLAELPHYYVMPGQASMAQAVAGHMPKPDQVASCDWLTDQDLAVYVLEYRRRGFQGGLQWYRCATDRTQWGALSAFDGQRIEVPSAFIAGAADWGVYQFPGAFEKMQSVACVNMRLCQLVPQAGHWVQQEQAQAVNQLLLTFLGDC